MARCSATVAPGSGPSSRKASADRARRGTGVSCRRFPAIRRFRFKLLRWRRRAQREFFAGPADWRRGGAIAFQQDGRNFDGRFSPDDFASRDPEFSDGAPGFCDSFLEGNGAFCHRNPARAGQSPGFFGCCFRFHNAKSRSICALRLYGGDYGWTAVRATGISGQLCTEKM